MVQSKAWDASRDAISTVNADGSDPLTTLEPADSKAHIIFVPGSWHTLYHTRPLVTSLEALGHHITPHQLASVGLKITHPTFADEVTGIRNTVMNTLSHGHDAILVLHSYAGMPGSEAINQLITLDSALTAHPNIGRLRRIIYISAYMFPPNFIVDAKMFIGDTDPQFSIDDATGLTHFADPYAGFFNDMSREEAKPFVENIGETYYLGQEPVITSDDYRKAPILYVQTANDGAVPLERQIGISKGMASVRLDTGHDPFVSQPAVVAELLGRVADSK